MRHGKKFNHLGRTASHRSAMLSNMASSLIKHKRINTTVAKAKALRKYIEPLITKAKNDTTHSRRVVFSYLQDKESVTELFSNVAEKVAARPGGYTRILKLGARLGDNAEMCVMELVDFNELLLEEKAPAKAKTRRSRRGSGKKKEEATTAVEDAVVVEDAPEAEVEAEAEAVVEEAPAAEATEEAPEAPAEDAEGEEKKEGE
ncbi:MAG: 50S ribosomal protein L17 [Cytophagales bacterium]|nr:50S ribosomal protein L17 [Cytophagales bacterium]